MHLHLSLRNIRIHQSRRSQAISAGVKRRRRHRRAGGDEASILPANVRRGAASWRNLWLKLPNLADTLLVPLTVCCSISVQVNRPYYFPDGSIGQNYVSRVFLYLI